MDRSSEQKLVDMCFEFAIMAKSYMKGKTNEQVAAWVAHNLKECGFPTVPMGMSWGVLESHRKKIVDEIWKDNSRRGIEIVEAGRPE